ncbi:MAG: hypothetical protein NTV07_01875 [Candidatus Omnitrophica bacterium]|nr:hypothetical protein [Candidatus Omnitrophota bacterium]
MTREEFLNEVNNLSGFRRAGKTKEEITDDIIQNKLLLLEAQKEGLDKQPPFMRMIQNFWEQSLLRAVVEKKMKEFTAATVVTDAEISARAAQIDRPASEIKNMILREKVNKKFEDWLLSLKTNAKICVDKKALETVRVPDSE